LLAQLYALVDNYEPKNGKITTQLCHGYFGWLNDELSGVISYL
jgi:hypothetical protein